MIAPKDNINDFLVKMKSEMSCVKRNQQLYAIPKKLDGLRPRQTFYYYTNDRKRQIVNQAHEICIEIDSIKPFSMVPVDYKNFQDSTTSIVDLVEYNKIYPIMIFIDGRFIPWENIDLIVSFEKYYLFIHDLNPDLNLIVRTAETIDMIVLPSNIYYSIGVAADDKVFMFGFNDMGEYTDASNATHMIYMDQGEIEVQVISNAENLFEFAVSYDKQLFPDNFIAFSDNLYDSSIELEVLGTFAKISVKESTEEPPVEDTTEEPVDEGTTDDTTEEPVEEDTTEDATDSSTDDTTEEPVTDPDDSETELEEPVTEPEEPSVEEPEEPSLSVPINHTFLVFSNPSDDVVTTPINNLSQVNYDSVKDDVKAYLNDKATAPEYIKTLVEDFEFHMDRTKLYAENRAAMIKYILEYRQDLYIELYELGLNYFTISADHEWIEAHRDADGYLSVGRKSSNGCDYYVMVFVNGELYEYQRHITYKANKALIPVGGLEGNETVELVFFRNAREYAVTNIFKKDEYLPLHEEYYNNRANIFCRETVDTYFQYPEDGNQHFPIPFELIANDDGDYTVQFPDDFYYGKEVVVAPDNTFKYFSYYLDEEDIDLYKVSLGTNFNYCNEYDRFFIFRNGRRLTKDYYRLTIPCRTTTPFYQLDIYLAIPLQPGDRLDVFYLPVKITDLDFDVVNIPSDGYITFNKDILPYPLSKKTYTFWVNGKKIPMDEIKVIDSTSIQLLSNTGSSVAFKVTAMGDSISEIDDVRKTIDTIKWDSAIAQTDYTKVLNLTKPVIKEDEFNVYDGSVPIISIMWELIREHYVANPYVDIPGAFIYDYKDVDDSGVIVATTDNGYEIIDAANANPERMDNLDIDRYYP